MAAPVRRHVDAAFLTPRSDPVHHTTERDARREPAYAPEPTAPCGAAPARTGPEVRWAESPDEREAIYRLRYDVYVREQDKTYAAADHGARTLSDPLDAASRLWYAAHSGSLVGSLRVTVVRPCFDASLLEPRLQLRAFPCTDDRPLSFSSRFVVGPSLRGTAVMSSLVVHAYAHVRSLGVPFDLMTTSPALVPLFERLGYVRYTHDAIETADAGVLIPMALATGDHDHLRDVRSAFLPATREFQAEPEWAAWLRERFPRVRAYYGARAREEAVALVAEALSVTPALASDLAALGFVHRFAAGDRLQRAGDRLTCTYIPLDARLRVAPARHGTSPASDVVKPVGGDDGSAVASVGRSVEPGSRVQRDVLCEAGGRVLCLPEAALTLAARRAPERAAAVLRLARAAAITAMDTHDAHSRDPRSHQPRTAHAVPT